MFRHRIKQHGLEQSKAGCEPPTQRHLLCRVFTFNQHIYESLAVVCQVGEIGGVIERSCE